MKANEFMHLPVGSGAGDHPKIEWSNTVAKSNRLPSVDDGRGIERRNLQ